MDISIHPVSGTGPSFAPAPPRVSIDVPAAAPVAAPAPAQAQAPDVSAEAYEATIRQAAISFKDVYALSDHSFTIFKDSEGKYITRYVSLRDGAITYVPEPTLVKQMRISPSPHISINV